MKPSELLDRLIDRFDSFEGVLATNSMYSVKSVTVVNAVQLRVCNVLLFWLENYSVDFYPEKMRFTVQIFLRALSGRRPFVPIVHKLAGLVFKQPVSLNEYNSSSWGVLDDLNENVDVDVIPFGLKYKEYFKQESDNLAKSMAELGIYIVDETESKMERHFSNTSISFPADNFLSGRGSFYSEDEFNEILSANRNSMISMESGLSGLSSDSDNPSMTLSFSNQNHQRDSNSDFNLFMESKDSLIARQLNLMEFEIFKKIAPRDLVHHIWIKGIKKGKHAPSVLASIKHFNVLSNW